MQDASLQESMGPIVDRTKENLVVHRQRHHHGAPPPDARGQGARRQGHAAAGRRYRPIRRVRSASVVLPPDQAYKDAAKDVLVVRKGAAQATV